MTFIDATFCSLFKRKKKYSTIFSPFIRVFKRHKKNTYRYKSVVNVKRFFFFSRDNFISYVVFSSTTTLCKNPVLRIRRWANFGLGIHLVFRVVYTSLLREE